MIRSVRWRVARRVLCERPAATVGRARIALADEHAPARAPGFPSWWDFGSGRVIDPRPAFSAIGQEPSGGRPGRAYPRVGGPTRGPRPTGRQQSGGARA
jgi:hypothetical protein